MGNAINTAPPPSSSPFGSRVGGEPKKEQPKKHLKKTWTPRSSHASSSVMPNTHTERERRRGREKIMIQVTREDREEKKPTVKRQNGSARDNKRHTHAWKEDRTAFFTSQLGTTKTMTTTKLFTFSVVERSSCLAPLPPSPAPPFLFCLVWRDSSTRGLDAAEKNPRGVLLDDFPFYLSWCGAVTTAAKVLIQIYIPFLVFFCFRLARPKASELLWGN